MIGCIAALSGALAACNDDSQPTLESISYPAKAKQAAPAVLTTNAANVKVYHGGFGSGITTVPGEEGSFYLLTDRGPNVDGTISSSKVFALPSFTPTIGKFKLQGDSLVMVSKIELKTNTGVKLTGLPNPEGSGGIGETAYDTQSVLLQPDANGLDSEGLVALTDGTFWISDEYGPHLVHVAANGNTIERINPYGTGTGGKKLPAVFAKRRPNRGMEGLTITPDGKTLVGIMQSTMYNPSSQDIVNKKLTRILFYDLATGSTRQYIYMQDANGLSNSDIIAITDKTFLVLERDGEYPKDVAKPAIYKRIYKIDISNATDISDAANGATGKLYNTKTPEQLTDAELQTNGVVAVTKTLVVDILKAIPDYPHDKAEGLAIVKNDLIALANDDDFGVIDDGQGSYKAKTLPATSKTDQGIVYFIKLSTPLK